MEVEFKVIPCSCHTTGHKVIFKVVTWDYGNGEKDVDLVMEVIIDERVGFWRRIKNALLYLIARQKIYIFEAYLSDDELPELQKLIQNYLRRKKGVSVS